MQFVSVGRQRGRDGPRPGGAATANGPQCDLAAAVQWASTPDAGGECDRLLYWASVGKAAANRPEDDCPAPLTGARCMWDPPVAKGVSSMDGEVRLQLVEDGADAERLDTLTGYLRSELLQLDVEDVSRVQTGDVPPGARAIDVVALGGLIVSLGRTATGLKDVVAAVRRWLSGGDGVRRTVKIEIDGDTLELSEVSAAEQDRLVDLFVRRHSGDEG